jgi:hypothetical protein
MRIHVGVLGSHPGWSALLEQEGVPFSVNMESFSPERQSILVLAQRLSPELQSAVIEYLRRGGGMLCSGEVFGELCHEETRPRFIQWISPQPRSLFAGLPSVDLYRSCVVSAKANEVLDQSGTPCVYAGDVMGGHAVVLPFDAGNLASDQRIRTKSFYAEHGRLPFEQVAVVSKGGLRRLVARSLEYLHHRRGMVHAHKWYFPGMARNVYALRIDTDGASRDQVKALQAQMNSGDQKGNLPVTWFIDVKSQERWLGDYAEMGRCEVGLHCFEHRPYKGYSDAVQDIQRSKKILEKFSPGHKGFAAPYGRWNAGIGRAIAESGFEYSSEFSYDNDNVPSQACAGREAFPTLQVPVHPISIGSLRRQGFGRNEMHQYFERIVRSNLNTRVPLMFLHHPKDGFGEVHSAIRELVSEDSVQALQMGRYAAWWSDRRRFSVEIEMVSERLLVKSSGSSVDVSLHVTRPDGLEVIVPVQAVIDLKGLEWAPVPDAQAMPSDFDRTRKFNPWISINRLEDIVYARLNRSSLFRK